MRRVAQPQSQMSHQPPALPTATTDATSGDKGTFSVSMRATYMVNTLPLSGLFMDYITYIMQNFLEHTPWGSVSNN